MPDERAPWRRCNVGEDDGASIVERAGQLIAGKLRDDSDGSLRQAHTRFLVDQVEVGHEQIRITGLRAPLAQAATGTPPRMMPKVERGWRTRLESSGTQATGEILMQTAL